jgi:hypothetical protein
MVSSKTFQYIKKEAKKKGGKYWIKNINSFLKKFNSKKFSKF